MQRSIATPMAIGTTNIQMVTLHMTQMISAVVIQGVQQPSPTRRNNILHRWTNSARKTPTVLNTTWRKVKNALLLLPLLLSSPPSSLLPSTSTWDSPTSVIGEAGAVNRPWDASDPMTLNIGTTNAMALSMISSTTGTHFPTNSNIVKPPNITRPGHEAMTFSIHPSMWSSDGSDFSMMPTRKRVRKGATPVLPARVRERAEVETYWSASMLYCFWEFYGMRWR
mmetsp:Transcript_38997/g.81624  ORF Transcript_38997/g.81624 Transcript_38997/m.81624 type:complete len:224 (-) Transcript_38997:183-854(-)